MALWGITDADELNQSGYYCTKEEVFATIVDG